MSGITRLLPVAPPRRFFFKRTLWSPSFHTAPQADSTFETMHQSSGKRIAFSRSSIALIARAAPSGIIGSYSSDARRTGCAMLFNVVVASSNSCRHGSLS